MIFYHGSAVGGLIELQPFVSEHKEPYIYFATDPVVALLYSVRAVEKPFNWYPYGFDKDGTVVYSEYYPDAFASVYRGQTGYLYECEDVPNAENPTAINCAYVCRTPVAVDRVTRFDDVYEKLSEYREQGLFRVKPFDRIPEKEMQMVIADLEETMEKYELASKPENSMSRFIRAHFPSVWNRGQNE